MLFSDKNIANYINQNFEPVWQSVRPVPIVRIDFGNGNVLTRTLHGNIATYVCNSGGQILDILPGIYDPEAYFQKLNQLRLLSQYVNSSKNGTETLVKYHKLQSDALASHRAPLELVNMGDFGKAIVERPVKIILIPGASDPAATVGMPGTAIRSKAIPSSRLVSRAIVPFGAISNATISEKKPQDDFALLVQDTIHNEGPRRDAIHRYLSTAQNVHPEQITKWLYKNVLHADLDDPYLGLGATLFPTYPFKEDLPASYRSSN